jgi:hypothetical protein
MGQCGTNLLVPIMAIAVRELLDTMGTFEIPFFRSLVSFVMALAAPPRYGFGALASGRIGLHTTRNVLHFAGQFAWVYAIGWLPLATVRDPVHHAGVDGGARDTVLLGERLDRGRIVTV